MPDRFKTAAIFLAAIVILQFGLSTAEAGLSYLAGRPFAGQAFSVDRPEPGVYALSLVGHRGHLSETLTVAELRRQPAGRIALGTVEAWRGALKRLWNALGR
ncbi:MAG TPA: hypothetical protein VGL40_01915 [Bacillota bacterium]|jgi:hypothetical protein